MQGKQLMIRFIGCTIRGYLEIMSQTFGSFNLPSRSTSTSASENTVGMGRFGTAFLAPAIVAVCSFLIRKSLKRVGVRG